MTQAAAPARVAFGAIGPPALLAIVACAPQSALEATSPAEADAKAHVRPKITESSPWTVLAGRPGSPPPLPAVLAGWRNRVLLLHSDSVGEYFPASDSWSEDELTLPAPVGRGVATAPDPTGLYILRGGSTTDFWHFDVEARKVTSLPATPAPVGVGGALAYDPDHGRVYAMRGDRTRDIWRYEIAEQSWTPVPDVSKKLTAIGAFAGAIMYVDGVVYAWPDHHIKYYNHERESWLNFFSYGYRPSTDGAMFARDRETDIFYLTLGKGSKTISLFEPRKRRWAHVRPRLPGPLSGEGNRAVVTSIDGRQHLLIYDIEGGNRMLRHPVDELQPITLASDQSDIGSKWRTLHEVRGASLVRNDTAGLLGEVGDLWYFGRFKGIRFVDPATKKWSQYPGVGVVHRLEMGLAAASDGQRFVYAMPGADTRFVRVDSTSLEGEVLEPLDQPAEIGAQLAFLGGRIHALLGGESPEYRIYDPSTMTWAAGVDLPDEATPVGSQGSGLIVSDSMLHAVTGTQVWRLAGDHWERGPELPHKVSASGGMVAADPDSSKIYLVEGGGSRWLTVLDLNDETFLKDELLPDAVSIRGKRAFVSTYEGERVFVLMRGHDTHEIFIRSVAELNAPPSGD